MATNYQQDGRTIDYLNTGETEIHSGEAVVVGALVGVAHDDILSGLWGVLHTAGVFALPKASEAVVKGQKLYLAEGKLTAEASKATTKEGEKAVTNPFAGTAWANAEAGDESVAVRLGF